MNGVQYTGAGNASVTPGGVSGSLMGIDAVRNTTWSAAPMAPTMERAPARKSVIVTPVWDQPASRHPVRVLAQRQAECQRFFRSTSKGFRPSRETNLAARSAVRSGKTRPLSSATYEAFRQSAGLSFRTLSRRQCAAWVVAVRLLALVTPPGPRPGG